MILTILQIVKQYCSDSSGNDKLMQILNDADCLEDFVGMVQLLRCGKMSPKILASQLCMDVSRFLNCKTTTAMRFRCDTKQFWEVVLHIGHGKRIRLCSGSKNQGALQSKANERGLFLPTENHINFSIPDVKSLTKFSDNIPAIIECGIIEKSLELLDKDKEYVLLIDDKKIAIGLGKGILRDINLWGFESHQLLTNKKEEKMITSWWKIPQRK